MRNDPNEVGFQLLMLFGTLVEYIMLTYYSKPSKVSDARIKIIHRSGILKLIFYPLVILSSIMAQQYGLLIISVATAIINAVAYKNFISQFNKTSKQ